MIYGQALGIFKRQNNECSRNGEKKNLHKNKIVVFEFKMCSLWHVFRHELRQFYAIIM